MSPTSYQAAPPRVRIVSSLSTMMAIHSNQESGATHEVRTRDLNLGKVALYQLS